MSRFFKKSSLILAIFIATITPQSGDAQNARNINQISILHFWHQAFSVDIDGNMAYVATGSTGLSLVNISDPANPYEVGYLPIWPRVVTHEGNYCYVGQPDADSSLRVVDVSNPREPREMGFCPTPGGIFDIAYFDGFCYVANGDSGFRVIDVANPEDPQVVGHLPQPRCFDLTSNGSECYISDAARDMRIIDVTDPAELHVIGAYQSPGIGRITDILVRDNICFIANHQIRMLDISNPEDVRQVGLIDVLTGEFCIDGNYCYAMGPVDNRLQVTGIDISDLQNPQLVGSTQLPNDQFGWSCIEAEEGICCVANERAGLRILDFRDPEQPEEISFLDSEISPNDVAGFGNHAVVVSGNSIVHFLDLNDIEQPQIISRFAIPGPQFPANAVDVTVSGDYCYIAAFDVGLVTLDISDIENPRLRSTVRMPGAMGENMALGVHINGRYLYIAANSLGFHIADLVDPARPRLIGHAETPGHAYDIDVAGNYCYVADSEAGIQIFDVRNPRDPRPIGEFDTPDFTNGVAVFESFCYVADHRSGLIVLDVSDPADPIEVSTFDVPGLADALMVKEGFCYLSAEALHVIDVRDPENPIEIGYHPTPGFALEADTGPENTILLADGPYFGIYSLNIQPKRYPLRRGWNILSSVCQPANAAMTAVWRDIVNRGLLIMVKDQRGQFYYPRRNFNNMQPWDVRQGYMAKLSEPDTLTMNEDAIPVNTPIPLNSGWNIVAYFPEQRISPEDAFDSIIDRLLFVKDENGRFYNPRRDFSNMEPLQRGKGYQVRVSEDLNLIWNVPERLAECFQKEVQPIHFQIVESTGNSMSILLSAECGMLNAEWEIGAFTAKGLCVGSTACQIPNSKLQIGLAVWGDDPTTEAIDGAVEGEALAFRFWDGQAETPIQLVWEEKDRRSYQSTAKLSSLSYQADGFAMGSFNHGGMVHLTEFGLTGLFPNPFNSSTTITFSGGIPPSIEGGRGGLFLRIYDLSGRLIADLLAEHPPLTPPASGGGKYSVVWDARDHPAGIYFVRLEAGEQVTVRKTLLLR